jgi:hypothetical protein
VVEGFAFEPSGSAHGGLLALEGGVGVGNADEKGRRRLANWLATDERLKGLLNLSRLMLEGTGRALAALKCRAYTAVGNP